LNADFGGDAEDVEGRVADGKDSPESDSEIESASGRCDKGIFVNSADVADGTNCPVEQIKVSEDEDGFGLETRIEGGSFVPVSSVDEDDGMRPAVEEASAREPSGGVETEIRGIWPCSSSSSRPRAFVLEPEKLIAFMIDAKGDPGGARVVRGEVWVTEMVTEGISSRR
jgi:hypothetical protein